MKELWKKLAVVEIFALSMASIETLIVVYIRMLYYTTGFKFPLNPYIEPWIYNVEIIREFFTIIMLATVAILAAKKFTTRFAYFIYAFAVWDISYYIWLKIILNWPSSIFTWDILFLIPIPWIGPVITPVICAIIMATFAPLILNLDSKKKNVKINPKEWALLILGSILILYTWMIDFFKLILNQGQFTKLLKNPEFQKTVAEFIPTTYNWPIFTLGITIIITAIIIWFKRVK